MTELTTPRLTLRNFTDGDAARFRDIVTHPEVGRMLVIYPPDFSLDDARQHLADNRYNGGLKFRLAIIAQDQVIGSIGCGAGDEPSIFYFLHPDVHGQGFASEIVPAFCAMIFARFPINAIKAGVFNDNPRSGRVLLKAGFVATEQGRWKSAARSDEAEMTFYRLARP